jgi:tetratricopeptide (TPR) repeat protein
MRSAWLLALVLVANQACKKSAPEALPEVPEPDPAAVIDGMVDGEVSMVEEYVPPTPEEQVDEAVGLLTTGNPMDARRARDLLRGVVDDAPEMVVAHLNLGVAAHQLGDLEGAATAFSRVTRLAPSMPQGWLYLGQVERQLGDVDTALRRFRKGLKQNEEDMSLRVAMVQTLREVDRAQDAVDAAVDALQVNARSLPIYNEMGLAYLALGDLDLASFVFEKAESIPGAEENATVQAYLGWTLYQKGERYAADYRLSRAVELDAKFIPGLVYLSRLRMENHDYETAVPLLEGAARLDESNHGVFVDLGIAYRGLGRPEDARRAWEKALEIDEGNPAPHFNLGILLGDDLKDYDGALVAFQAYLDGGGTEADRTQQYMDKVDREKSRAERRRSAEADRARRQAEREERQRLLKEAEEKFDSAGESSEGNEDGGSSESSGTPWGPVEETQEAAPSGDGQ